MNIKKTFSILLLLAFGFIYISPAYAISDIQDNKNNADNQQKKIKVKKTKRNKKTDENKKIEYMNLNWWDKFNDPILTGYIQKTAGSNYDIKINALKVLQSKEAVKEGFSYQLPSVNFAPDASRAKYSGNIPFAGMFFPSYYVSSIKLPINVNYELDIWGKNHFATKKLRKEYEAVQYDEKAAFISLTVMTGTTYFNILNIDKQIQIQQELVNIRKEILDLTRINYNYGLASSTDVTQMDKLYTESLSNLTIMTKNRAKLLNQLSVLIGESSVDSANLQRGKIDNIKIRNDIPESISAEIINARPDILKSEAELQAAMFDVKSARRNLLPSINLTGAFGFNAYNFERMFDYKSFIYSLGAGFTQPIFQGGRLLAQLRSKKYKYEEMFNNYKKTILTSIQEVNDSLFDLKSDKAKNLNDIKRVQDEKKYYQDMFYKYEKGAVSYLDTLKFKETLLTVEQEEIQSKTECLVDSLGLYKSTGGNL